MSLEGSSLVSARKIHKQVVKIFGRTKVSNVRNTVLRRPNEELKGPWVLSMPCHAPSFTDHITVFTKHVTSFPNTWLINLRVHWKSDNNRIIRLFHLETSL